MCACTGMDLRLRNSCRRQLEVKNVAVFDEIRKIREIREIRPAGNGGFPDWDGRQLSSEKANHWCLRNRNSVDFLVQVVIWMEHVGKSVCKLSDLIVLTMHHILLFTHKYV